MISSSQKLGRRAMLVRSAQAAAMALAAPMLAPLFAAPQSRGFSIGACDWSLGKRCNPAALEVAKEIGLDGVQISLGDPGNNMKFTQPEVQNAYQETAKRTGVKVASLAIDAMWHAPLKSDPRAAQWLLQSIDICKAFDMSVILIACFDLDPASATDFDRFVEVAKGIAPKAEKQGIIIGMENWLSAEDHLKIVERVASPAVKVYYDVGNSTDKGRDVVKEIRRLGPAICEIHFKDGPHLLGQGRIDFRQVRQALDDIDYQGWIHLESAAPHGVVADYKTQYKYLREIFPAKTT